MTGKGLIKKFGWNKVILKNQPVCHKGKYKAILIEDKVIKTMKEYIELGCSGALQRICYSKDNLIVTCIPHSEISHLHAYSIDSNVSKLTNEILFEIAEKLELDINTESIPYTLLTEISRYGNVSDNNYKCVFDLYKSVMKVHPNIAATGYLFFKNKIGCSSLRISNSKGESKEYTSIGVLYFAGKIYDFYNGYLELSLEDYIEILLKFNEDIRIDNASSFISEDSRYCLKEYTLRALALIMHKSGCGISRELWDIAKS